MPSALLLQATLQAAQGGMQLHVGGAAGAPLGPNSCLGCVSHRFAATSHPSPPHEPRHQLVEFPMPTSKILSSISFSRRLLSALCTTSSLRCSSRSGRSLATTTPTSQDGLIVVELC